MKISFAGEDSNLADKVQVMATVPIPRYTCGVILQGKCYVYTTVKPQAGEISRLFSNCIVEIAGSLTQSGESDFKDRLTKRSEYSN